MKQIPGMPKMSIVIQQNLYASYFSWAKAFYSRFARVMPNIPLSSSDAFAAVLAISSKQALWRAC